MSSDKETRTDLIRRCRNLEDRFILLTLKGEDCSIAINWAQQWASAMLDMRGPVNLYSDWIEQQEKRADRMERQYEH